nr:MAG TPA: Helix-turn-helix XRE-family like protein [Caudoviricetes sp.]
MIPEKTRLPLAEWRKRKLKISQQEAAKLLGVSKDTLSNYERGVSFPDVPIINNIEKIYGIKYDQIIFLTTING